MENVQFQIAERRHTFRRASIAMGNQFFFGALVIEAPNRIVHAILTFNFFGIPTANLKVKRRVMFAPALSIARSRNR